MILEGTDPAKANAQAVRCTGGVEINRWDRISLLRNLENQSKSYSHSFFISSEARELLLREFSFSGSGHPSRSVLNSHKL